ncbi:MAG: non-canonical purine NTP pyrophosphatase [Acidobacteriaceae bacterium]
MPLTLYVASSNPGKLRDFRTAAEHTAVEILPLPNLAAIPAPEETGRTFADNARLKAEFYSRHLPGQLVLADDSGLEVPALHNDPGVRSARYADDANFLPDSTLSNDERNNLLLLYRMQSIPDRAARYRCVLSLARDGAEILSASGEVPGQILTTPRGTGGFGYDPLFHLPQLAKTMAEIDLNTRHHLSHRGAALRSLLEIITLKDIA